MGDQLRLTEPTPAEAAAFLTRHEGRPFSYQGVGATRDAGAPPGYRPAVRRVELGRGRSAFEAAVAEARAWRMFDLPWVQLYPAGAEPEPDTTVAVVATWAGLWSMNALRVVYAFEEGDRAGFATGTLPGHLLAGEERFTVSIDGDDMVHFEVASFSRPDHPLASLGLPVLRRLQARFRREATARLAGAASGRA